MPRPEKHVFICTQARPAGHPRGSCAENGCAAVAEAFFSEMQSRGLWGKLLVSTSGCLGPCDQGPNVLVYPESVLYTQVSPEDVKSIFDEHLIGGTPVERLKASEAVW